MKTRAPLTSRSRPRDLDATEADLDRHVFGDLAGRVAQEDPERVARRLFRRPAMGIGHLDLPGHEAVERRGHPRVHGGPIRGVLVRERQPGGCPVHEPLVLERPAPQRRAIDRARLGAQGFGDALDRRLDDPARRQLPPREADRDGQVERAGRQVVGQAGVGPDVGEMDVTRDIQEDRPGDAAVPPLVLVLDVGRIRPLHDPQGQGIASRPQTAAQVELRGEVRVLPDPDLLAVEADDEDALRGPDMEHDTPVGPPVGEVDLALVDAGRVPFRDLGRQAVERHLDVRVVRVVPGARHRPDTRDIGLAPVRAWLVIGACEELEAPTAIERETVAVGDAVHQETAESRDLGEGPRSRHSMIVARPDGRCGRRDPSSVVPERPSQADATLEHHPCDARGRRIGL